MMRMLTMATVHFQARVREELQARLAVRTEQMGIPYYLAMEALKRIAHERCRAATTQLYTEAAEWTAAEWAEVREVAESVVVRGPVTPC